jgi:hypothetical protein
MPTTESAYMVKDIEGEHENDEYLNDNGDRGWDARDSLHAPAQESYDNQENDQADEEVYIHAGMLPEGT